MWSNATRTMSVETICFGRQYQVRPACLKGKHGVTTQYQDPHFHYLCCQTIQSCKNDNVFLSHVPVGWRWLMLYVAQFRKKNEPRKTWLMENLTSTKWLSVMEVDIYIYTYNIIQLYYDHPSKNLRYTGNHQHHIVAKTSQRHATPFLLPPEYTFASWSSGAGSEPLEKQTFSGPGTLQPLAEPTSHHSQNEPGSRPFKHGKKIQTRAHDLNDFAYQQFSRKYHLMTHVKISTICKRIQHRGWVWDPSIYFLTWKKQK